MLKFRENEDAVSPVIGVILMVAITVILAAVIAAFVFGMSDNIAPQKEIVVTATQSLNDEGKPAVTVKVFGGKDVNILDSIIVFINDAKDESVTVTAEVGGSGTFALNEGMQNRVVVKAKFNDGSEQIVLDKVFYVADDTESDPTNP